MPARDEPFDADAHVGFLRGVDGCETLVAQPRRWRSLAASIWRKGEVDKVVPAHHGHGMMMCLAGRRHGLFACDAYDGRHDVTYRANALCFIPAGQTVTARFTGSATDLHVLIEREVMTEVLAELWRGDPDRAQITGFNLRFDARLRGLLSVVRHELEQPNVAGDVLMDGVAVSIAALLASRQVSGAGRRKPQPVCAARLDAHALRAVMDTIEDQLGEKLSIATLAQNCGLSMFQFSRAFRATTGQAPHQYVISRRLTRARELIAGTADDLADIAYACGFCSQAHMTTTFTKRFGVTPGRLRANVGRTQPR